MAGASDTLGERFRTAREARGLSISDVAEKIRIRSLYLSAIEEESWSKIGAPVYIRGFIRTYARFLGLDPEEAVATFNRTQPAPPPTASSSLLDHGEVPAWRSSLLIGLASLVAVVLIGLVTYNELTMRRAQLPESAPASAAPAAPASVAPVPEAKPATAVAANEGNSLVVRLSAPSWLRVTVDGNVSMEGTFPAGTLKTFHGRNALVRIGNAGGVEIYVDGRHFGKLGKSGDVAEHDFTL
jgi:cytoskeleton protein RodZ